MAAGGIALVVFRWLKQPPVLGYLIAGALISPNLLPAISDGDLPTIRRMADLGLIVLLFTLGVEFGWQRIRKVGPAVVFIGVFETALMMYLGYRAGIMLGWSSTASLFLGAGLAQTSSAVLIKFLRDSGRLNTAQGQLILGVSVVEDLLAVVLLTLLTGIASTGGGQGTDTVGWISMKLVIFGVATLVFGTLIVPRLLGFLEKFKSTETLLLGVLALCFGLGLVADELGVSAAAGAFLIGTVIGDTKFSETVTKITSPVRDLFAALFFVSVGMLVDFSVFDDALVPIVIVTAVFIVGKVVVNSIATYLAGYSLRTSFEVGVGMPLMGEFTLAIAKVGTDYNVVGAMLYPVIAGATAVSSFMFPFIMKASGPFANLVARTAPPAMRRNVERLTAGVIRARKAVGLHGEHAAPVKEAGRMTFVNLIIIAMLLAVGSVLMRYSGEVASAIGYGEDLVRIAVAATVITMCVPSALVVWRSLSDLAAKFTDEALQKRMGPIGHRRRSAVARVVEQAALAVLFVFIVFFSMPSLTGLLTFGTLAAPAPIIVLLVTVAVSAKLAVKAHEALENAFHRTILGE